MIIKFKGERKSLKTFESDDLKDFSVIMGKNGCGKSQLIELIGLKPPSETLSLNSFAFEPNISNIQIEGIDSGSLGNLPNNTQIKNQLDTYFSEFNNLLINTKLLAVAFINNNIWPQTTDEETFFKSISILDLKDLVTRCSGEISSNWMGHTRTFEQITNQIFQGYIFNEKRRRATMLFIFVAKYTNKEIGELTQADFYNTPLPEYLLDDTHLFKSSLNLIFNNYAKRRDQNRRLFFEKNEDNDVNNSISDKDFIKRFTPPWELINRILNEHDINFKFEGIDKVGFKTEHVISCRLIKTTISKAIGFHELSSGEKVIMGLIIKLFHQ
jgi:energy-coupling factor transporter ATP-binding protein EcfA2